MFENKAASWTANFDGNVALVWVGQFPKQPQKQQQQKQTVVFLDRD